MADVYASAVGTTVLQAKEIPPRPSIYDGVVRLFDLKEDVNEVVIRTAFEGIGVIVSVNVQGKSADVHLTTHKAALRAKTKPEWFTHVCGGIDTLYNERSYDGCEGEAGREDDEGRGW